MQIAAKFDLSATLLQQTLTDGSGQRRTER